MYVCIVVVSIVQITKTFFLNERVYEDINKIKYRSKRYTNIYS